MKRPIRILLILLLFPPALAAVGGWLSGPMFLHPMKRALTADLIRDADESFKHTRGKREDFVVKAPDGAILRGWKVRAEKPNGSWVLLFHGVSDNRIGVVGQSEALLQNGYSVVMMDSRAHGDSGGDIATYGWFERKDTSAVIDALELSEKPQHLFALGESMGAGIALQSAGADPRIEAVVAEASFANLQEAAYDYAGLREYPWLGKTLFAPGAWLMVYRGEKLAGFPGAEVSPEKAVAARTFPILIICDKEDHALPCRHSEMIVRTARGPKELWRVPHAYHTAALGYEPDEFRRRVLGFFERWRQQQPKSSMR
ncbi:MAG TPA: alpha/beta fold hydrolase [Candidatus Dormibacteraeota bacterium]|jgi:alpha-beta hydrolase superfamily lysophospholipase|nr:alpha/beta fold hydrolase [Candidatus Dormibacteraeota bacterium]